MDGLGHDDLSEMTFSEDSFGSFTLQWAPKSVEDIMRTCHSLLLLFLAPTASAQQSTPDLILTHGRIFTADSTRPWAEALAIHGERVVAVGTSVEVERLKTSATRVIDLAGRTVIPGFNDAHIHVSLGWPGVKIATSPDPISDPSRQVVADSLRAAVSRTPERTWISVSIGPLILDDTFARRPWLDSIAPQHPVRLAAGTGHGTILNSRALEVLGIADTVRDPLGGWYERGPDGRVTGLLHEYAQYMVPPTERTVPTPELMEAYRKGFSEVAGWGLTTLQDMEGTEPEASAALFSREDLPVRIRVMSFVHTTPTGRRLGAYVPPERPSRIGPMTYVSGVKYILDGSPVERFALMRRPYAGRPGWYGRLAFPIDTMRTILTEALQGDQQAMLHAVGDSTIALVLGLMTQLAPDSVWRARRVRLEHADMLAPDLIPVARRLGIVVVQNPSHLMIGSRFFAPAYGPDFVRWFQPVRSLLAAGIPLALGSDGPVNPFLNLMFAVTNPHQEERLTLEQAVRAYTRGSAYAERMEQEKGTLAPGMLADLAVLSQDIFSVPVETLPGTTSVLTLVGGRVVHDAGVVKPRPGHE
jgi:predicted amidohydrolase YtcJ